MKLKKSLGQNFLKDLDVLSTIVDNGEILYNDTILEIGPGSGNLTEEIIKKNPKEVIVIEKDNNLSKILNQKYGIKIKIINKDILKCFDDFNDYKKIIVFGNLPYNISTKILISFIKLENLNNMFKRFVFVFQKEVADRIVAEVNTKNYGRLSILTYWKMEVRKIIDIKPEYFYPKPKVWSSLVVLTPKLKIESLNKVENLEYITNIFFNQRRKKIKNPMKQLFKNYENIANNLKIDLNLRPQNIPKNKYLEICKTFEKLIA